MSSLNNYTNIHSQMPRIVLLIIANIFAMRSLRL